MFQVRHVPAANAIRRCTVGLCAGLSLAVLLAGCDARSQNETTGNLVGGAAGPVIDNPFGKESGKAAATAIAAVLEATVGREFAAALDETSRRQAHQSIRLVLDTADVDAEITWENPDNAGAPASGSVDIARQGANQQGRTCRRFRQTVTIGGEAVQSYGTACRDGNGDWMLVSGSPF